MERPTCGTCPFWERFDGDFDGGIEGECHRQPPVMPGSDIQIEEWLSVDRGVFEGMWPETSGDGWCGEHPDFPEYVASLRPSRTPATPIDSIRVEAALRDVGADAAGRVLAACLGDRDRRFMGMLFGLTPEGERYDINELARVFKVTRERARQIREVAMGRLMESGEVRQIVAARAQNTTST